MHSLLAAAAALTTTVLIASGCASAPDDGTTAGQARTELVYRTGSNIPVRERVPLSQEEKDKKAEDSKRMLQQMQTTGAGSSKQ